MNRAFALPLVLQGFAGAAAAGAAVMSFAAKSAILDFAGWTTTVRSLMKGQ